MAVVSVGRKPYKTKTKSKSPTQVGLAHLRAKGWTITLATWWNPYAKRRIDLWSWQDAQALVKREDLPLQDPWVLQYRLIGVQFCRLADAATHEAKIRYCLTWPMWRATGAGTLILGVGLRPKDGKRGARKVRTCVERWVL